MIGERTINLVDFRPMANMPGGHPQFKPTDQFKIDSLKNSTILIAGAFITDVEVRDLISQGWDVHIRKYRAGDEL